MKIQAQFIGKTKAPVEITGIDRLTLTDGDVVLEIMISGAGLRVRLDAPLGDALTVFPHATNCVVLQARREDDV